MKVGIFGLKRGMEYADNFLMCNANIVAVCDYDKNLLNEVVQKYGKKIKTYTDFDEFLKCNMDAVVIANYFHQHAHYVIKCLDKGIHVFCECSVAVTMSECVKLINAANKSKAIFMLAENYPFLLCNNEIKRIYDEGTLGKIMYAEGEYNHPIGQYDKEFIKKYVPFPLHWRNYLPRTYYLTHSLAPLMYITGAIPKRVTAMPVYHPYGEEYVHGRYVADRAAIITILNNDNSVFKITGCSGFGAHNNSYRLCGEYGQIENIRGTENKILLRYDQWNIPEGKNEFNLYDIKWNDKDEKIIKNSGHGGSDYLVVREFVDCVNNKKRPKLDIYFAVYMAEVAILAHKSLLKKGIPFDIPDLSLESERKLYGNDNFTPFVDCKDKNNIIPCCSNENYKPSEKQLNEYLKVLKEEN